MTLRGQAAPRQEQVFFSSRSHHTKTKKVKVPEPSPLEPISDKSSDAGTSKKRISTVASLRAVRNVALPNSRAHLPGTARERSGSGGSSTIWGSLSSTMGGRGSESAPNVYATPSIRDSESEATMISSTISSMSRNSADRSQGRHSAEHVTFQEEPMARAQENRRSMESRMSHVSTRSGASQDSNHSANSVISESNGSRFWDDHKIHHTVNFDFIEENLRRVPGTEHLVKRLRQQVSFGEGLTETTYAEWIISRAQKFFLILVDLGIPEQIFGITDESWADDDLPVSMDAIPRLKLSAAPDAILDKKFHKAQYSYLLRFIYPGGHIDFEEHETIPLEVVRCCNTLFSQPVDEVRCPRNPETILTRRKFYLVDRDGNSIFDEFMEEIQSLGSIQHHHILELYASYTYKGYGYLLFTPATNFTLGSFLRHPPSQFAKLTEDSRRFKLLDWMRCLSDALAHLYDKEIPHGDIRPRSIVIDGKTGDVHFSDVGSSRRLIMTKGFSSSENERYEYSAPEMFQRVAQFNISQAPTSLHYDGGRIGRKLTDAERESPAYRRLSLTIPPPGAEGFESARRGSLTGPDNFQPATGIGRRPSVTGATSPIADRPISPVTRAFSTSAKGVSAGPVRVAEWVCRPAAKSDVFSLGCIMLDMLTFHSQKKKLSSFASARARHNRAAGSRGGGQPDSSFHANIPETIDWLKDLKKEAVKRDDDAICAVLMLVSRMLAKEPEDRPTPREVGDKLFHIMSFVKKPHCEQFIEWTTVEGTSFSNWSGWDDPHEYGASLVDGDTGSDKGHYGSSGNNHRNADRDSTDPYDVNGVLGGRMSLMSFGTFGHGSGGGASGGSEASPRGHRRYGSWDTSTTSSSGSNGNSYNRSLMPSRVGLAGTLY